jgi:hypothetical protein
MFAGSRGVNVLRLHQGMPVIVVIDDKKILDTSA